MTSARVAAIAAACVTATILFAGNARAEDECRLLSRYDSDNPPTPAHTVSFVFTGVEHEEVAMEVDETTIFKATLETLDWSTEYSGAVSCVLAGRYRFDARIGAVRGVVYIGVSERTTIYVSKHDGIVTFNIWGPNAPGLD